MANFKINKIRDYYYVSRNNSAKDNFKCACCKRKTPLANAKLAYNHSDVWNGHQGVSIYAYRLCPDCKKEKDIKVTMFAAAKRTTSSLVPCRV